eukprot:130380_1
MLRIGAYCYCFALIMDNIDEPLVRQDIKPNRKWFHTHFNKRIMKHKLYTMKKFLKLLCSIRTIAFQLICWLCIYLITHIEYLTDNLETLGTSIDLRIITMIMSFAIIFSINQSFQRRERTLQDLAKFKSNLTTIYYSVHQTKNIDIFDDVRDIVQHLVRYMTDTNELRYKRLHSHEQKCCISEFYQVAYKLFDYVKMCQNESPKEAVLTSQIGSLIEMFERICATKDYNTPLAIRSFSVMMIWIFPVILSPYFVWHQLPEPIEPYGGAYFWSWLFFLLFGSLLDVKKSLDNIFNGQVYQEDIQTRPDEVLNFIRSPINDSFEMHNVQ